MSTAYISIGSNLGNREENCRKAVNLLKEQGIKVVKLSSAVETRPWGLTDQPMFINMALSIETDMPPEELLAVIKCIESDMGRRPAIRWGPRIIDLDILLYEDLVIKSTSLEIPHPEMCNRDFVLKPLLEIAPDVVHPVLKKSIKEIAAANASRQNYFP